MVRLSKSTALMSYFEGLTRSAVDRARGEVPPQDQVGDSNS
jgi:hypothetical protein